MVFRSLNCQLRIIFCFCFYNSSSQSLSAFWTSLSRHNIKEFCPLEPSFWFIAAQKLDNFDVSVLLVFCLVAKQLINHDVNTVLRARLISLYYKHIVELFQHFLTYNFNLESFDMALLCIPNIHNSFGICY